MDSFAGGCDEQRKIEQQKERKKERERQIDREREKDREKERRRATEKQRERKCCFHDGIKEFYKSIVPLSNFGFSEHCELGKEEKEREEEEE